MKMIAVYANFMRLSATFFISLWAFYATASEPIDPIDQKVEALLKQMTSQEKAGQLTQISGHSQATGPVNFRGDHVANINAGLVGSMLNVQGVSSTRQYQDLAMQSRLKIPLLFAQDVIHGYHTTFPIPLAESASWDLAAIERSARIAAIESSAAGIHWTFAPMVDVSRDPRWGRVMEGAGEDTYLGSRIAAARVTGFQTHQLGGIDSIMATAKHFVGYGAAVGGRDYNSVDMSERQLWESYLPPFKAAVDAGVATLMNAFNDLNGIPATGNRYLQRDVLKNRWSFGGLVVSDWGSIGELVTHGFVKTPKDAAQAALLAGSDMDMESHAYSAHLPALVAEGKVPEALLDAAVRRVLRKKFELGLFDDPYRFSNPEREKALLGHPTHFQAAREMAAKSIVLLKNEVKNNSALLPLGKQYKTIAFVGPFVKADKDNLGAWAVTVPGVDYSQHVVTQWQGLQNRVGNGAQLLYAKGSDVDGSDKSGFAEALAVAQQADVVIVSVGERANMSGEAKSRTSLRLPGVQEDLVKALQATGKPIVLLINAGRPLIFDAAADAAHAVLYTWWLGSEAGNAIADVLFGDVNPSAKLTMSFPRSEGQIPLYYNHLNTGRPVTPEKPSGYVSAYIDSPNTPRYPFGYGLSYTAFAYSDLQLSSQHFSGKGSIRASFTLTNTGKVAGEEVAQLYLRDPVASVVRPVKELKDFQKILLQPGESRRVEFVIDQEKLAFTNAQLQWGAEAGDFELMVGASSADIRLQTMFSWQPEVRQFSMLRTDGTRWVKADGSPIALKGVNLGNWLLPEFWMLGYPDTTDPKAVIDQCSLERVLDRRFGFAERERLIRLWRDNWITERDWDLIPQFGLNIVRLPLMWSVIEDEKRPFHLRPDAWHYLDKAIAEAEKRGLYVVLDLHGAVGAQGTEHHSGCAHQNQLWSNKTYQERTRWLWKQIAQRYKDRASVAAYDLLNEPWGSTPEKLADLIRTMYKDIRAIDTQHIILLPDHPKGGIAAYGKPSEHGMKNVVFQTHPYPGFFGWGKPGMEVHRDWLNCLPKRQDGSGGVCDWVKRMEKVDAPLYLGEFQPWATLDPELGGQITRASFDRYAELGWASSAWAFKKFSSRGGKAPVNWGMVTNAEDAPMPALNFETATLAEVEDFFKRFGSVPYQINAPVLRWMNSATPPTPFH